jgi:TPR repeat protein
MKVTPLLLSIILISQASAQSTFNPGKSLDFIPLDDPDLEIKLINAGAISGDAKFQLEFGLRLLKGTGISRNTSEGLVWINKAADQNSAPAQLALGELYWTGEVVERDYVKACQWYHKAAIQGVPLAEYLVGFCYGTGTGITKDLEKGASWYEKSANHGNMFGQFAFACCLHGGHGVEQNMPLAIQWFRKAAEQGHADALTMLALKHFEKGEYEIAKSLSKKGADAKDAISQYVHALSIMALPGGKDSREAANLLLASAQQGHAGAQQTVGQAYLNRGLVGVKDSAQAVRWLKASAEQGDAQAQYLLGGCYATGNGTLRDDIEAYALLNLSGITNPKAKIALDLLEKLMSPDARIAAQQRAKQLQADIEKKRKEKEGAAETIYQLLKEIEREKSRKGA